MQNSLRSPPSSTRASCQDGDQIPADMAARNSPKIPEWLVKFAAMTTSGEQHALKNWRHLPTLQLNASIVIRRKESAKNKQTNHSIQKLYFSSALCLLASYHLGVWIRSSVCFIAFPCRNVAASIQVFKVWRAILPVLLLLSHIQDSWRVLSSSPLSAVLLPFLQKSVFVAVVLTLPTPSVISIYPIKFLSWTLNKW